MKFFKNFKTKQQLIEENERLKAVMSIPQPIHIVEREVQKVSSCMELSELALEIPTEYIKKQIAHNLATELEPFIEWDIEDNSDEIRRGKIVRGNVYLAKRK